MSSNSSVKIILFLLTIWGLNAGPIISAQNSGNDGQMKGTRSSPIKPRSLFLRTPAIRIHYLEWNPKGKSTVVLLHGLYDSADIWKSVAPLIARDYRIIAVDRRGSGLTDKPRDGYEFPTLAKDVISLIEGLELGRVHLVGHSAGGGVALTVAAAAPTKLESVVLLDGGFWPKRQEASTLAASPACKPKDLGCLRSDSIERGNRNYDPEPLYERVEVPVLFIVAFPPEPEASKFSREIEEAHASVRSTALGKLRYGTFVVVRDSGHWIQRDQPAVLVQRLHEFFTKQATTPLINPKVPK